MLRRVAPLCTLLALTACTRHGAKPTIGADARRPRLVVLLVVDQLPLWSFDKKAQAVHAGFARLLHEGQFYHSAQYPYATTATSVGHTALASGAPPATSGIISNKWYERGEFGEPAGEIEVIEDPHFPALEVAPVHEDAHPLKGVSPRRLQVESMADALLRASPASHAISISIKPRAAVLMGGQHPTRAIWYEPAQRAFTTSRYYGDSVPPWLAALAHDHPIEPRLTTYVWKPLDGIDYAARTGLPDAGPYEPGKFGLMGSTFPHVLGSAPDPAEALVVTPLADEVLLEAAVAALPGEHLGEDNVPDLLTISFSAHDYVGHAWGLESWESADQFARLDVIVGQLLDALDAHVGRGNWALVFASDHGGTPVPEHTGGSAAHVDPDTFRAPLEAAAREVAGPGDWLAYMHEQFIYLSAAANALPAPTREKLLDALVETLKKQPGVAVAMRTDRVRSNCDQRSGVEALVCRSAHTRAGELFWAPPPGSVAMKLPWDATNHVSPNPSDRTVPIIAVGPGFRRGANVITAPVSPLQIAPTLAQLLGVPPPRNADRRDPLPR